MLLYTCRKHDTAGASAGAGKDASASSVFAVQSLGWVEIAEEDLTRERSSKAVNKCIVDLSRGTRRDFNDAVGRWGDVRLSLSPINTLHQTERLLVSNRARTCT